MAKGDAMAPRALRGALSRAREQKILSQPELAESIKAFEFLDQRSCADMGTEKVAGITAAQDQLKHAISTMTARYARHRRGKLVKPTK
jgi:hypothetical protein